MFWQCCKAGLSNLILIAQSQGKKIAIIKKMLASCGANEAKYIIRSLEGKLRIRLAERTVLVSLSQAVVLARSSESGTRIGADLITQAENVLKTVFSELPNYDIIVPRLITHGFEDLQQVCKLTPGMRTHSFFRSLTDVGIPLKPMLAKPTKSISEVLDRFEAQSFTCEYKYDGERAQVHCLPEGGSKVYSRNSEDMSAKYPDLIQQSSRMTREETQSYILDGEVVAWDRDLGKILPFQILSTRKRKDVNLDEVKIKVCYYAFDLLYLNGVSLLKKPFAERRKLLHESFREVDGEFAFAKFLDSHASEDIEALLHRSVADSCEGLMVKMLEGPESAYEPSKRSRNWLKVSSFVSLFSADQLLAKERLPLRCW